MRRRNSKLLARSTIPIRPRVIIVTDVKRGDMAGLAGAYAQLIEASGGGTLGLFTAIRRLRTVYARIADRMAQSGLPIYASMSIRSTPAPWSISSAMPQGQPARPTDALRDGVDVPGQSLRLVVMESVPWPNRPNILHAPGDWRVAAAPMTTGSFARDWRRPLAGSYAAADDHGHFVILSSAFPTRLLSAFPEGTPVERMPLEQALAEIRKAKSEMKPIRSSN